MVIEYMVLLQGREARYSRALGFGTELLTYLNRSGQVRCFNTQVDLTAYGKADEQPVIKTEVINKLEHVFHTEVYE